MSAASWTISSLAIGSLRNVGAGGVGQRNRADIFGVIGDAHPIERRFDLDVVAHRVLDRFALRIAVRICRRGLVIAEDEGVERPAGVDMGLAEEGLAIGPLLGERGYGHQRRGDTAQQEQANRFHVIPPVSPGLYVAIVAKQLRQHPFIGHQFAGEAIASLCERYITCSTSR